MAISLKVIVEPEDNPAEEIVVEGSREGGEFPGGLLEVGEQEVMTSRAAAWRLRSHPDRPVRLVVLGSGG